MTVVDLERLGAPHVMVLADRCAGCQECVIRCPTGALSMQPSTWTVLANDDACVGCRQCVRTCPFGAITVDGAMMVADRFDPPVYHPEQLYGNVDETRIGFASWVDVLVEADRCLTCPDPTCVRGCPAHNDIPGFIGAVRNRDLDLAHQILRRTTVLPDICSRVCNQSAQCEGACTWSLAGGVPVAIGRLERFVTDHAPIAPPRRPAPDDAATFGRVLSVGIVGSGPAGMGSAWELIEAGAEVTVYEKESAPGGLCIWGMPDFTLPEEVAARPWVQLIEAGVTLHCNTEIHANEVDRLLSVHDAVVVAHGAGVPMRLPVPGADLEGVVDATTFLQGAKVALESNGDASAFLVQLGVTVSTPDHAQRVLVLGAGNTAMDVARMVRRLGLDATCVDWLDERFALARPDELAEARHEGVEVRFQRTLTNLHGVRGRVSRAELAQTHQTDARHSPKVATNAVEELTVALVVMAMGYRTDPSYSQVLPGTPIVSKASAVADRRWAASGILANCASEYSHRSPVGTLALDREVGLWAATLAVSERLWVVGDALSGPSSVVEAMSQGRRAASAILDALPSRPGRTLEEQSQQSQRVLVCYASAGGKTAAVAETVANCFAARGSQVSVASIAHVGARELAQFDVIVVGSWVDGLVVTNVHPARAMREWLVQLPRLGGRRVAIFCTYAVNPKGTLQEMREAIERRGGVVFREAAFGPRELVDTTDSAGPALFGRQLVAHVMDETEIRVVAR